MSGILDQILRSLQGGAPPSRNLPTDLNPLLDQLRQAGLGRQVDSWIGTGPNEPVEPQELERALGGRGGGGLGDILGGVLGGGRGGGLGAGRGDDRGGGPGQGGGLSDILGGVLGGGRGGSTAGGLGGGLLGGLLAQALPYIINAMTPRGRVADEDVPEGGLGRVIEGMRSGKQGRPLPDTGAGGLDGMLGRTLGERRN